MNLAPLAAEILEFWFGPAPHATRDVWFRKDPAFDAMIVQRFGAQVEAALRGAYRDWTATPHGTLARVLLLDQFTRNIFRDTPRAFAGDEQALAMASAAVDARHDRALDHYERRFLYMPFEHAEDPRAQERSLALFGALASDLGDPDTFQWAEKHATIIRRFGRFPHRNAILGRAPTAEEVAFLQQPGSRF
jgi:uncharacterized protein (DUF924 family)